ncbi:MAG: HTTM domain-containing protein [Actinomycetota bacterium]|nr:HTTM domain-containing protein [Actinomycetota bacterium]
MTSHLRRAQSWLCEPAPLARVAVFRILVYGFLLVDVLYTHAEPIFRAHADPAFYQPLLVGRLLPLPVPSYWLVVGIKWSLVVAAVLVLAGKAPRLLGWTIFVLYFEWLIVAFSYGKVDHDRFAYLVALAVLPTVAHAGTRSRAASEAAGWALRMVQLAVVATYFYAAFAKLRFGGPEWVNSATIARAVVRRGTALAEPLLAVPWTLHVTQWVIMVIELAAPLLFVLSEKWRRRVVVFLLGFHAMTWAMIMVIFLPHVVCLLSFLPLERLAALRRQVAAALARRRTRGAVTTSPPAPTAAPSGARSAG